MAGTLARVGTRGMQLAARKMAGGNAYFRAGQAAYQYGPDVLRAGARIASWAMRRKRRAARMNDRRTQNYGSEPKAQAISRTASTSVNTGTLYVSNMCSFITLGTGPTNRQRQWADVVGLKLNFMATNTNTSSALLSLIFHVAVVSRQGINTTTIGDGFFTDPTVGAGYQGISFAAAQTADKQNVHTLPIHKGRYKVHFHRKYALEAHNVNATAQRKTMTYGSTTTYQKIWIPLKKRIFFDPDDTTNVVQNPIFLCFWCETIHPTAASPAPAASFQEFGKLYFKNQ